MVGPKRFAEAKTATFNSNFDLLIVFFFYWVFRLNLHSVRSKVVLCKDWVCSPWKKFDTLRVALCGRWGLGHIRFPDLQTYQWSFMFIFFAVHRTRKLCMLQKYEWYLWWFSFWACDKTITQQQQEPSERQSLLTVFTSLALAIQFLMELQKHKFWILIVHSTINGFMEI